MVIEPSHYGDNLMGDYIRLSNLPQGFIVDAVKCLFKVNETDKQWNIPLYALLTDVVKRKYLVCATFALLESSLFFTEFAYNSTVNSV